MRFAPSGLHESEKLACVGDHAGDRAGGGGRGTAQHDLGVLVAHAAGHVAVAGRQADLTVAEHALVRTRADRATARHQRGAGLQQNRRDLIKLLNDRAVAARAIGRVKQEMNLPIYEPGREEIIMKKIAELNTGPLPSSDLQFVFQNIIAVMRAFQRPDRAAEDANAQSVQSS